MFTSIIWILPSREYHHHHHHHHHHQLVPGRPIIIILPTRTTHLANCISQEWKYISEVLSFLLVIYEVTLKTLFLGRCDIKSSCLPKCLLASVRIDTMLAWNSQPIDAFVCLFLYRQSSRSWQVAHSHLPPCPLRLSVPPVPPSVAAVTAPRAHVFRAQWTKSTPLQGAVGQETVSPRSKPN